MARVDSHPLSDWKEVGKKTASEQIHDVGQDRIRQDRTNVERSIERHNQPSSANRTTPNRQVADSESPSVRRAGADVQTERPAPRSSGADTLTPSREQAFIGSRDQARTLNNLSANGSNLRNVPQNAGQTNARVVAQNIPANNATHNQPQVNTNLPNQNIQPNQRPDLPTQRPQPAAHSERSDRTEKEPSSTALPQAQTTPQENAARPIAQPLPPAPQSGEGVRREARENREHEDQGDERGDRSSSAYRSGRGNSAGASEGLGRLLEGGVSSEGGSSDGDAADTTSSSTPVVVNEIPDHDDSLVIFNEPNNDFETVIGNRNIFEHHVVKTVLERRVAQIEHFNNQLDRTIRDVFATRPLSERIEADALRDIEITKFQR